ncbi:MAG: sulfatase-like hydrolase/transferase [Flavicella sp.]
MRNFINSIIFLIIIFIVACNPDTSDAIDVTDTPDTNIPKDSTVLPNILLIIADDMGVDASPSFAMDLGAQKPYMPILSSLISDGISFDNAWSYATCSPTRASILTGKHGMHTQILTPIKGFLSGTHTSLQSYIGTQTENAYACGVFGKWHLGNEATHPTQTMNVGTYTGNLGGGVPDYWQYKFIENELESTVSEYATTRYTQAAIDWKSEQTKPWFLWLAYNAAHTPFHKPDNAQLYENSGSRALPAYEEGVSEPLPYYLAMLEAMDFEMGRLLDSMTNAERENTVVIFIGDNGSPKKVSQWGGNKHSKGSISQGGVNVPLVVSGNKIRNGVRSDALVQSSDLFATIAELAGVPTTNYYNSHSFKPTIVGELSTPRNFLYVEVPGNTDNGSYAVRNQDFKLIHEIDTGIEQLYNLSTDPRERTNLLSVNHDLTLFEIQNLTALRAEALRLRH